MCVRVCVVCVYACAGVHAFVQELPNNPATFHCEVLKTGIIGASLSEP